MPVSLDRQAPALISAEIKGEVKNPGVYEIKNGGNLKDLIDAAGGETEIADTSDVVLSSRVRQGQIFVIGKKVVNAAAQKISISTADVQTLQLLPGIGPAMAQRIVEYRQQTPFQALEDLMNVKGIGEKTFEKLKERICL